MRTKLFYLLMVCALSLQPAHAQFFKNLGKEFKKTLKEVQQQTQWPNQQQAGQQETQTTKVQIPFLSAGGAIDQVAAGEGMRIIAQEGAQQILTNSEGKEYLKYAPTITVDPATVEYKGGNELYVEGDSINVTISVREGECIYYKVTSSPSAYDKDGGFPLAFTNSGFTLRDCDYTVLKTQNLTLTIPRNHTLAVGAAQMYTDKSGYRLSPLRVITTAIKSEFMPIRNIKDIPGICKNPALALTAEERAAKYAEMKAADVVETGLNKYYTNVRKVLPNLLVFNYKQTLGASGTNNRGTFSLTDLNGGEIVMRIWATGDDRGLHKLLTALINSLDSALVSADADYWETIAAFQPRGTQLRYLLEEMKIDGYNFTVLGESDQYEIWRLKINESLPIGYITVNDKKGFVKYCNSFISIRNGKGYDFYYSNICKEFEDSVVLSFVKGNKYIVNYPNGERFEGELKFKSTTYVATNGENKTMEDQHYIERFAKAKKLSDIAVIWNGYMFNNKNLDAQVYIEGEVDEIESMTYNQQQKASREAQQKAKEEARKAEQERLARHKAALEALYQKYGKENVERVRKYKKAGEFYRVGAKFGLVRAFSPFWEELMIDYGTSQCYDLETNGGKKLGYIWVENDTITTLVWYY